MTHARLAAILTALASPALAQQACKTISRGIDRLGASAGAACGGLLPPCR